MEPLPSVIDWIWAELGNVINKYFHHYEIPKLVKALNPETETWAFPTNGSGGQARTLFSGTDMSFYFVQPMAL